MNQIKEKFQIRNWELVSINPNKKNWEWGDYFCFWAVSFQSVIGFSLIASFYLLYDLNTVIVLLGCFIAVLLTMLLGGLWHGAAWTFIVWGLLHGALIVVERLLGINKLPEGRFVWIRRFFIFGRNRLWAI